jgi:hypothetical protein
MEVVCFYGAVLFLTVTLGVVANFFTFKMKTDEK